MIRIKLFFVLCILGSFFISGHATAEVKKNQVGEVFELGEIVVTADSGIKNLATTITEVSAEDIIKRGAQTAADALEMIPGVDVQQGGKNAWVFLRGFDQEDIKVLIDGVPAYQTYDKVVDLSLIPVDSISKITVTKGASSVLYGANTFGGVINIITKKGGKEPEGELTVSFGDKNDTRNAIFNYGGSAGIFNYWLTASSRKSDGFELSDDFVPTLYEDGGTRNLSDYDMTTISSKVGLEPNDTTKLYVSFDYHNNEKGIPTTESRRQNRVWARSWTYTKWDQWHLNFVGEKKFSDMISSRARVYYVSHKDTIEDVYPGLYTNRSDKWFETSSYDDNTRGAEVQTSFDFGPMSFLTLGLNYLNDNHKQQDYFDAEMNNPGLQPEQEYEAKTYTVALEDQIRLMENDLSFVFGASYDYYKPTKAYNAEDVPDSTDSFNPQAGVVYNLSDNTSIHSSVGKKIRFPRLKELYSTMAGGNPDLNSQETVAYDIGADHYFTPAIKTSASYFYNDIKNLIERIQDPETSDRYYANVGEATIEGLEFAFDYQAFDSLSFGTNYTYLSTSDDTNNTHLLYRPRHKIGFDTRYNYSILYANLQASYSTGAYEGNGTVQSPGFFLINASVEIDLTSKMIEDFIIRDASLFLKGYNLFDKNYYEGLDYQAGRSLLLGLNVKF
jgi:iron complex outermembrane receptor protein/outer membrane receptor for ferrienterochelin and colicins